MTPADLRRLLVRNPTLTLTGFTINGVTSSNRFLNIPRKVQKVRSKDFLIVEDGKESNPSYMNLPKASELAGDEHSFTITTDDSLPLRPWIIALTYKVN